MQLVLAVRLEIKEILGVAEPLEIREILGQLALKVILGSVGPRGSAEQPVLAVPLDQLALKVILDQLVLKVILDPLEKQAPQVLLG